MLTWLEQERHAQQRRDDLQKAWPIIQVLIQYYPSREGNRPYRLETLDDHATKPRQRWYESHRAVFEAIERANPRTRVREA